MNAARGAQGLGGGALGALGAYVGRVRETLRSELYPRDTEAALTLAK